jgi:uncharacterized membrane protein
VNSAWTRLPWGPLALAICAVALAFVSAPYLVRQPEAFSFVLQRETFAVHDIALRVHVFFGGLALLIGPAQLWPALRRRQRMLHRGLGALYAVSVAAAAIAGLILAPHAFGGATTTAAFTILALLWLAATGLALAAILRGDVAAHRLWMVRSYAMTFAAVTLRAYLGTGIYGLGLAFEDAYRIAAWASWTLNLIIADWCGLARRREGPAP